MVEGHQLQQHGVQCPQRQMANAFVVIGSAFGKCHFVVDRFLGQEYPLEKGMETHSSILAWQIPWTEEPGRLESIGSQRAGHD